MEIKKRFATSILAAAFSTSTFAADFSFTGNLGTPDDVQLFNFTVNSASTVTLKTYSYAGGVNSQGQTIARGGFDPILSVFDSTGVRVDYNDDGGDDVPADLVTDEHFDTFLQATLAAGTYTVSVSQFAAFPIGNLADGFQRSGFDGFIDIDGDTRDSHWAFDVLGVDTSSVGGVVTPTVPVPGAAYLFGSGLIGLFARRRSSQV